MIEYEYTEGRTDAPVVVRLDGKVVGKIQPVEGGWQYVTKNNNRGLIYPTFTACQKSLATE